MNSLISIIIPVYQAEETIQRCLDSVLSQSYSHWEAICVNDGSTDGSGKLLEQYASRDERIKVIHQENQGVSSARNKALDSVRGEYVTFVDSDDWVDPDLIKKSVEEIKKADADLFVCGIMTHDKSSGKTSVCHPLSLPNSKNIQSHKINKYVIHRLRPADHTKLFKKSMIDRLHLRFNKSMKLGEDTFFLFSYLSQCETIVSLDEPLYHYVSGNENSACGQEGRGKFPVSQYQRLFLFLFLITKKDLSYIDRRDWINGIFARICDNWLQQQKQFKSFPQIRQLSNIIFKRGIRKLFLPYISEYTTRGLIKVLIKFVLKR